MLPNLQRFILAILVCVSTLSGCSARADELRAKAIDTAAQQLLGEVVSAYKDLASYSDQGVFTIAATIGGKAEKQTFPLRLTFSRPNKINLDTGEVRLVSDGTTLTTTVMPLKKYYEAPAPKSFSFQTLREGPVGSVLFGGPTDPAMFVLGNLLVGDNPLAAIEGLGSAVRAEGDSKNGGVTYRSLRIDRMAGPDMRLLVDPRSKLLKVIDFVIDPDDLKPGPGGEKVTVEKLGWDSGTIVTEAPKGDAFAYKAPKGFEKVESFAQVGGGEAEQKYAVHELVGKPAPDFTLTLLDGEGKTRTVSKSDLAGKVVMIDFWATWCGPCLKELPEIQKLVESYAKDKKDVVIVALSQDDDPREPVEVRKLVEKTLRENKIELTGNPVGVVGIDPSKSVGDAFKIEGFPTVVLIDGKGTIQAAHVGPPEGSFDRVQPVLAKAIDTLLAGKPLAKPEAAEAAAKGNETK